MPSQQVLGKTDHELFPQEYADLFRAMDQRALEAGVPTTNDEAVVYADGRHAVLETTKRPLWHASGEVLGVLGVARDITQRKVAERALKESELRWQFALEGAGDGIWDWDVPKAQIFRSRSWYRLLGQQREADLQPVGSWLDAIHPDDRMAARAVIEEMLRGSRDGYSSEYRMRAGDGTWRWMLARGKVMQRDADGQALRVLGVTSDITARKQAEWALRESESLFRRLADTAPVMIWMANADHQVTYVNRTWLEFTGRALDQELGNGWVDTLESMAPTVRPSGREVR
jgi:PAS domain S-box-containing protein